MRGRVVKTQEGGRVFVKYCYYSLIIIANNSTTKQREINTYYYMSYPSYQALPLPY